jgi:hypothetical protein
MYFVVCSTHYSLSLLFLAETPMADSCDSFPRLTVEFWHLDSWKRCLVFPLLLFTVYCLLFTIVCIYVFMKYQYTVLFYTIL